MSLPLHERAHDGSSEALVRMTLADLGQPFESATRRHPSVRT